MLILFYNNKIFERKLLKTFIETQKTDYHFLKNFF